MKLEQAESLAAEICDLLKDFATRIEVAGGIRRGKKEPHDIEIVAVPRFERKTETTPLGTEVDGGTENMLDGRINHMISIGELTRGDPDKAGKRAPLGPRYYRVKYKGEKLDIFAVIPPAQWGAVFAIRTGDADYSHWAVQQGYAKGVHEVKGRLVVVRDASGELVTQPFNHDKIHPNWTLSEAPTAEEADFFKALGVPMVAPELRDYNATRAITA